MPVSPQARAFAKSRLIQAPDMAALKTVWESFGFELQKDPDIQETKDAMKNGLSGE